MEVQDDIFGALFAFRLPAVVKLGADSIRRVPVIGREQVVGISDITAASAAVRWGVFMRSKKILQLAFRSEQTAGHDEVIPFLFTEASLVDFVVARVRSAVSAYRYSLVVDDVCQLERIHQSADALFDIKRYLRASAYQSWLRDALGHKPRIARVRHNMAHPLFPSERKPEIEVLLRRIEERMDGKDVRNTHNAAYLKHAPVAYHDFFEKRLRGFTAEQIEAVLVFEDANLAVAAAGSGKTSVLVTKILFAVESGQFSPHEILALTFNDKAAREIRKRLKNSMLRKRSAIMVRTFHSFGASLIFRNNPSPPKVLGLTQKGKAAIFFPVLDELLQSDSRFRTDIFEWVTRWRYPEPALEVASGNLDDLERRYQAACRQTIRKKDRRANCRGFDPQIATLSSEVFVRSLQEAAIVNWLVERGIEFEYECDSYELKRQFQDFVGDPETWYRPDFRYKVGNRWVYHEHFALDSKGRAPDFMGGQRYVDRAANKRAFFKSKGLDFFETTSARFDDGTIFEQLERRLRDNHVPIGPVNEQLRTNSLKRFRAENLLEALFLKFIPAYWDSGISETELFGKADIARMPFRVKGFLRLAFKLSTALRAKYGSTSIDFTHMLDIDDGELSKRGLPYKLVLVDEAQDISARRMTLVEKVLRQNPKDAVLFMVGDDWQAINRFAGADIELFKRYLPTDSRVIEHSHTVTCSEKAVRVVPLSTTFRCAAGIVHISNSVIAKNPSQVRKKVIACRPSTIRPLRLVAHERDRFSETMSRELERIASLASTRGNGVSSVFILSRYSSDDFIPEALHGEDLGELQRRFQDRLEITVESVHGSKGLEADYVLLIGIETQRYGFPCMVRTDPYLELVLPPMRDPFEEERRLFYVAITRAKDQVIILFERGRPSEYVLELNALPGSADLIESVGPRRPDVLCPCCKRGTLRITRPTKPKVGCTRYPICGFDSPLNDYPQLDANEAEGEACSDD